MYYESPITTRHIPAIHPGMRPVHRAMTKLTEVIGPRQILLLLLGIGLTAVGTAGLIGVF
jgi:hypothetical protein